MSREGTSNMATMERQRAVCSKCISVDLQLRPPRKDQQDAELVLVFEALRA